MKVTKISYGRVFSLGNYENEKIAIEAEVHEDEDLMRAYVDLKKTVEHAHEFRDDLRKFDEAKRIISNPDAHTGHAVKRADEFMNEFKDKYPNLIDNLALAPASVVSANEACQGDDDEDRY
jgi:hypothetical protein